MDHRAASELAAWVTEAGLAGQSETALLSGFCERAVAAGLPLARSLLIVDTLHPVYEGRVFRWQRGGTAATLFEYGPTTESKAAAAWRRSPFYRLVESGESFLPLRVTDETAAEFPILADMRKEGVTGYLAIMNRFAADAVIGEMDCVHSGWATDVADGFAEATISALRHLAPFLALAVKCASLGRITETLVETYLGRDAGRRVLSGRIGRGVAERIGAVLWFSDLRGYTRITDTAPPEQIIPLLNDYAEAVISAIHEEGGEVLKLIGDGTLAIFQTDERAHGCGCALAAFTASRRRIVALNERRGAAGLPTTKMYLGLHVGEVFYGNVGSAERLDFTVVGPAVNEASRIAAMCRSVDQDVLLSSSFAEACGDARGNLISVGRYALRGVGRPQELFTLEADGDAAMTGKA